MKCAKVNGRAAGLGLILAMREPWLTKLLSGEKTAEVRRTRPRTAELAGVKRLYLYRGGCIYGWVPVAGWSCFADGIHPVEARVQPLVDRYAARACLTPQEMLRYLHGFPVGAVVYKVAGPLSAPVRYAVPVPVPCRPQGWQYMTAEILALLPDGKEGRQ